MCQAFAVLVKPSALHPKRHKPSSSKRTTQSATFTEEHRTATMQGTRHTKQLWSITDSGLRTPKCSRWKSSDGAQLFTQPSCRDVGNAPTSARSEPSVSFTVNRFGSCHDWRDAGGVLPAERRNLWLPVWVRLGCAVHRWGFGLLEPLLGFAG